MLDKRKGRKNVEYVLSKKGKSILNISENWKERYIMFIIAYLLKAIFNLLLSAIVTILIIAGIFLYTHLLDDFRIFVGSILVLFLFLSLSMNYKIR
jgi:ABC-type multidrug transport system fused ATPase/permease subunit